MADHNKPNPAVFREYAGVLCAFIVVISFVAIGFIQMGVAFWRGFSLSIPGDWMAAMLSLGSTALGFLIGKQTSGSQTAANPPVNVEQADVDVNVTR